MKPIYFPHTYLPPARAALLRTVFPALIIYQPIPGQLPPDMQGLAASGFLEIVAPAEDDGPRLVEQAREFERWSALHHRGSGLLAAFAAAAWGADPLAQDGTPTELAWEIRRRLTREESPTVAEDLTLARLLLHFGQETDRRRHEVDESLQRCENSHAELLKALRGKGPGAPSGGKPAAPGAEDERLIALRIQAWATLFLHRPCPSGVFVTCSPAVIEFLAEKQPSMRRLELADLRPDLLTGALVAEPAAADLLRRLEGLLPDSREAEAGRDGEVAGEEALAPAGGFPAVYAAAGVSPLAFCGALASSPAEPIEGGPVAWTPPSTLIVLIP